MTKDQKKVLLVQLDMIITLHEDLSPEKRLELLQGLRKEIEDLGTRTRVRPSAEAESLATELVSI